MGDLKLEQEKHEEKEYLEKTLGFIKGELVLEQSALKGDRDKLITAGREMWENTAHFSNDYDRLPEMNQHLSEVSYKARNYEETLKRIDKYNRLVDSPYFGRFDFLEEGANGSEAEKIYIGISNLIDSGTFDIYVYDWRAPISSIFYQYEPGRAAYNAPEGLIEGEVKLKRQYKIQKSALMYFFDSDIRINDELLQEVLGHNSSPKMRNIVKTIQKEQDVVIRDSENELLLVQGIAGSGKTSIALHRIAYLLYQGINSKLGSNDIIIISPSLVFSKYISDVLPELGEENVRQLTFDNFARELFGEGYRTEGRSDYLEHITSSENSEEAGTRVREAEFKGSGGFKIILDRLVNLFERKLLSFEDVYFEGRMIFTKQQLKGMFLNNKINMPVVKRIKRIENIILNNITPLRKERLRRIEGIVKSSEGHEFEKKSFSRLLSIKEAKKFMEGLHKFTDINYMEVYKMLFQTKGLFEKLSEGLEVPEDIESSFEKTLKSLDKGIVMYEDCAPLVYLKLVLEGYNDLAAIKQVVIDEAQDYSPLHYEIFKLIFSSAKFTVLGDVNQSIEKDKDKAFYDEIESVLNKNKSIKLFLNKGYRSSYEINSFSKRLLSIDGDYHFFERHEKAPVIKGACSSDEIDSSIIDEIENFKASGYESIAVICKTAAEAAEVHGSLSSVHGLKLLLHNEEEFEKGVLIMPSYLSKGLEFDVVIIYDASALKYNSSIDKKLLYIACTRALHRLLIYYAGSINSFF